MARNTVDYEWDVEVLDEHGDIEDHHFHVSAMDMVKEHTENPQSDMVLVRSVGNNDDGVVDRLWAYVKDGKLPEYFEDSNRRDTGYRVPKRFHEELRKAQEVEQ